jgi:hypothetical protein
MSKQIKNAKQIQSKSRHHTVRHLNGNVYQVVSASSGKQYNVRYSPHGCTCTCDWGQFRPGCDQRSACSHAIAVINHVAGEEAGRRMMVWTEAEAVQRQHRPAVEIGDGVTLTSRLKGA